MKRRGGEDWKHRWERTSDAGTASRGTRSRVAMGNAFAEPARTPGSENGERRRGVNYLHAPVGKRWTRASPPGKSQRMKHAAAAPELHCTNPECEHVIEATAERLALQAKGAAIHCPLCLELDQLDVLGSVRLRVNDVLPQPASRPNIWGSE